MSVLVKGMEMPESCAECGLEVLGRCGGNFGALLPANFRGMITRPEYCPLIEVPTPHGRLIDADNFIVDECQSCDGCCEIIECDCLNCKSEHRCDFMQDIINAPTVIEAEEG